MPRGRVATLLVGGVVVVLAGAILLLGRPSIPAGAASVAITRTVLTGPLPVQPSDGPEPTPGDVGGGDFPPSTPKGQACLDRIERQGGWLDLCWEAEHSRIDGDPQKDYYLLRVYGSHHGLRWLVIGSQLVGIPAGGAYETWPTRGVYEGACREVPMGLPLSAAGIASDQVCGRTESTFDHSSWSQRLSWTCEGCLTPDQDTRAVAMWALVGVEPGEVPSWDLFADGGT